MLGGELQRRARHAGDENAALRRGRKIDRIGARAKALDQLQLRIGLHECGIDRAAAEDQNVGLAAFAQIELRRHRNERYALALVQAFAQRMNACRVHLLRHEELARPIGGDLAGSRDRIASETDDVVVIEDRNG